MDSLTNELSILAAVISAVSAVLALYYSGRATRIAQKSLEIVEQQELRRTEKLSIRLIDPPFKKSFRDQKFRVYAFYLQISNKADADNSIREIQLIVEVHGLNNVSSNIIIFNDPKLADIMPMINSETLPPSKNVQANSVVRGYVLFRLPYEPIEKAELDSYLLKIIDIHGNESVIEPIYVNEWREQ